MNSIVIVEDHPIMREGLADYFSKTGRWQVKGIASSIAEAKEILTDNQPDVILLDIQLEDGWSLDIISWFDNQKIKPPLAAVYTTFDDYAHVSAALSLGVQAYVTKRRDEKELEAALFKALEGTIYIDEAAQLKLQTVTNVASLLTKREAEILTLVKNSLSNKEIASNLGISRRTVENILSCVYDKTGIRSRLELERL